jgi:pimeloyl-ACP methyl ester carboxylesterase
MTIKRYILIVFIILCVPTLFLAQDYPTVYLFPGQGSDEHLFDSLKFVNHQKIVHIKYPTPEKGSSMNDYAKRILSQIDTSQQYIYIGVSLGGMIISELMRFSEPKEAIIISSAKTRSELPFRYRFQKTIPIYKIVPPKLMLVGAKWLQPIVEPDRDTNKSTFRSMLNSKDPLYMKRTVEMIIKWDRLIAQENLIHIHGTKDHTIPIRNVKATDIIEGGSHMMTLTNASPINQIIVDYLTE